jgi:hypothetical protein
MFSERLTEWRTQTRQKLGEVLSREEHTSLLSKGKRLFFDLPLDPTETDYSVSSVYCVYSVYSVHVDSGQSGQGGRDA